MVIVRNEWGAFLRCDAAVRLVAVAVRINRVVRRAEVLPSSCGERRSGLSLDDGVLKDKLTGRSVRVSDVGHVLAEDDGEASLEVEVDVAMEEPRARVVRREANGDVVTRRTSADGVTLDWVDVVVLGAAGRANNVEGVLCATSQ